MNKAKILVVDDNSGIRAALQLLLPKYFKEVKAVASPNVINSQLREFMPDVILLDMNFQSSANTGNEGLYWLSEIKKTSPTTEVVLFTAYADISLAVEGMKRGAFDFIVKPWENEKLISVLDAAYKHKDAGTKKKSIKPAVSQTATMHWGSSPAIKNIFRTVNKIASTDASILITGENGTGKDVLAAEIHRLSDRGMKPMVCVDAGAITETLFESELFGHVKGAFTDAHTDRVGKIEQANGSTLFLDEIGNIPLNLQAKLLRVLQNRTVSKVGSSQSTSVDIRLICATNRNLEEMIRNGEFREDLYYRINTMHLQLPPLRERTDEIIPLAEIFIKRYAEKYHREVSGISSEAEKALVSCRWNGNIRELQNTIEKAVILTDGTELQLSDFCLPDRQHTYDVQPQTSASGEETLEEVEERTIRAAMERYNGNLTHVAKSLNISRPTLYTKLKKYNI